MAICYRVSNDHRLPLYWAYSNGWELHTPDEDDTRYYWTDERAAGAQVWGDLRSVICGTYWHSDGEYGPGLYGSLLLIESPHIKSCDPWDVITEASAVRSVSLQRLHDWLSEQGVEDRKSSEEWLDANEYKLVDWISANAKTEPVQWYDSLPCPRTVTHIDTSGKKSQRKYPTQAEIGD